MLHVLRGKYRRHMGQPSVRLLGSAFYMPPFCRDLMEGKQQHSWSSRTDKLFFRGALTGNRAWLANDGTFMNSSHTDVQFAKWTGDPSVPFVSLPEHCDYR